MIASLIYLVAVLPILLYIARKPLLRLLTPKGLPDIPSYPDPQPLWGDAPKFKEAMDRDGGFMPFFDKIATDLGAIAQLRLGWFKTFVIVTDYPTVEHILTKQAGPLDRARQTTDVFQGLVPTGQIALPTNEMWKHHRRLVGPAMTSKYLSLATPKANEAIGDFIKYLNKKIEISEGRSFAMDKDMEAATMDAICCMAFGSSWGTSKSYEAQIKAMEKVPVGSLGQAVFTLKAPELHDSMLYLFESVDNFSPVPKLSNFITSWKPTYRKHHQRLGDHLKDKFTSARGWAKELGPDAAAEMASNTLDMMVARELRGEDWMSDEEMRDELYLYLIAGTETSATTLTWWAKWMTANPDIQRKLRAHVLERVPEIQDRPPTFEDLNATNTPYLEAVVHEVLRVSRTAGGYAREAMEDVVILGKRVPKGTTVILSTVTGWEDRSTPIYSLPSSTSSASSVSSVDTDSDTEDLAVRASEIVGKSRAEGVSRKVGYWNAGSGRLFQPERWLDSEGNFDINAGPSLPFSLGQRACFGKNLALLELRLFICQLNQAFFFASVPENQNSFESFQTITTHPRQTFGRPVTWESI